MSVFILVAVSVVIGFGLIALIRVTDKKE